MTDSDNFRKRRELVDRLPRAAVLLWVIVCVCARDAQAQESQQAAAVQTAMYALQEARKAGLSIPQEQERQYVAEIAQGERRAREMTEELEFRQADVADPNAPTVTPLSHIRGKDGVDFPSAEDVILKPLPTWTAGPTPTEVPVWSPKPYIPPSKCQTNETKRVVWNEKPDGPENEMLNDILFVERDLISLDPEESFGKTPRLVPYQAPFTEGTLITMEIYSVPCVPYRIRMTNVARYYDQGLNALKNYDGDVRGRGKLSPFVQRKLFGDSASRNQGRR